MVGPRGQQKRLARERAEGERVGGAGWADAEAEDERAGALGCCAGRAKQAASGPEAGWASSVIWARCPFSFLISCYIIFASKSS